MTRKARLLTSYGEMLYYIGHHPGCTVAQMSDALFLTKRSIWDNVAELRNAEFVRMERFPNDRKRYRYYVRRENLPSLSWEDR